MVSWKEVELGGLVELDRMRNGRATIKAIGEAPVL